ncbi:helix-turn-helix domain-containing protein [Ktedonospora formicarum]|nr:helix-turn-helix transcriptional regulator [Ktedonospora formicarum]
MLKAARLKKSWTPEFVSGKVGVSRDTYIRWEAGSQAPRLSSLQALCTIFEMSPIELGFADLLEERMRSRLPLSKKSMLRPPQSKNIGDEEYPEATLSEALHMWSLGLSSCWQLYMVGGQHELERLLPTYLAQLTAPTLHPGPEQQSAASLTAQIYGLMALLELQRGDFVSAQMNGTQALVYSQLAKNWNLYIASQLWMASIFSRRKRIGAALGAYNDALKRINITNEVTSPLLHGWIFAGLAEIQAAMNHEQEAMQFLRLAMTIFPEHPQEDTAFSYTQCDRSLLYFYQGQVSLHLGKPRQAWEVFAQVDEIKPKPPERTRAEFLKLKAYTSLVLGNMVQSCIYLEAAAHAAQSINSDLIYTEIYTLYEHMLSIWGQEARVRSLAHLFQR